MTTRKEEKTNNDKGSLRTPYTASNLAKSSLQAKRPRQRLRHYILSICKFYKSNLPTFEF